MVLQFESISDLPPEHRQQAAKALGLTTGKTSGGASSEVSGTSEADLQKDVIKFLHSLGYKILVTGAARIGHGDKERYVTPYRCDGKGFVDCFAVKPGAKYPMLALELKSSKGKASPEQVEWLLRLSLCGVQTGIVTPEAWPEMKRKFEIE